MSGCALELNLTEHGGQISMRRTTSCPQPSRSSAASELLSDAFPYAGHPLIRIEEDTSFEGFPTIPIDRAKSAPLGLSTIVRLPKTLQGASFDTHAVAPASSRVALLDILAFLDIGVLILGKYLTAEHRAAVACTCTSGKEVTASEFFSENLLFADCPKLTDNVLHCLVLRAKRGMREGANVATFDISRCKQLSWGAVKECLSHMGRLKHLRMSGEPLVVVQFDEVPELLAELKAWSEIVDYSLRLDNRIGAAGAEAVAAVLGDANCKLHTLDLSCNGIRAAGAVAVAAALGDAKCKLHTLDLSYNGIGAAGAVAVAAVLGDANCKLHTLDLSGNGIGAAGAVAVAAALGDANCKLHTLDLSENNIGDAGAEAVAAALGDANCKLHTLDLSCNGIRAAGAVAVAAALGDAKCKLHTLDLSCNRIEDAGAVAVAAALGDANCKLHTLDLSGGVGRQGYASEVDAYGEGCGCEMQKVTWDLPGRRWRLEMPTASCTYGS
ncbi:hypothetical protein CYMTET_56827 [Cymbomonas tetramitiformis]|uniref:Uncharacterized protein n=1 Tax=Cymbomonas tetramitiformis TaxID=36881 RepID=A0AAE0BA53_9CHLO|nr:hypothetical protein CYMTET_56827 [Cymbomonas tetramitiformis]